MPTSHRPACARCLKRTVTFSPCRPRTVRFAISRKRRTSWSAIPRGRLTEVHRVLLGCNRRVHAAPQGSEGLAARACHQPRAHPTFYYSPVWSPDSRKIAYADKRGVLYYIDIAQEHPQAVRSRNSRTNRLVSTRSTRYGRRTAAISRITRNYRHFYMRSSCTTRKRPGAPDHRWDE